MTFSSRLCSLSIRDRILGGFLGVLAITIVAGAIAILSLTLLGGNTTRLEKAASNALLAGKINADMAKTLLHTRSYIATRSEASLDRARLYLEDVRSGGDTGRARIVDPTRAELVAKIAGEIGGYQQALDSMVGLYEEYDRITTTLDTIGSEALENLNRINDEATLDFDFLTANSAAQIQAKLLMARLYEARFLRDSDPADLARALDDIAGVERELLKLAEETESEGRRDALIAMQPPVAQYAAGVVRLGEIVAERNSVRDNVLDGTGQSISDWAAEIEASAAEEERRLAANVHDVTLWASSATAAAVVVSVLAGLAMAFVIARSIVAPVAAMTAAMKRLAGGDTRTEVPGKDRGDEIGQMAVAVQVFKENAVQRERLEAEQERERRAKEARAKQVAESIALFDGEVGDILQTLAAASNELDATAQSMAGLADDSARRASAVAAATEQTTTSVQSVASATDEMNASISEIARQVNETRTIAETATGETARAKQTVDSLVARAESIGNVVELISGIAEQTNLLALNATIEAARSGVSGKGFAVVASEVKKLAGETAKATEDIARDIQAIQAVSGNAAKDMDSVGAIIRQMNEIATGIAAAMEEQNASTHEIASNTQQAASGTRQMSQDISQLTEASQETGHAAQQVLTAARDLSQQSTGLKQRIETFLSGIRAA